MTAPARPHEAAERLTARITRARSASKPATSMTVAVRDVEAILTRIAVLEGTMHGLSVSISECLAIVARAGNGGEA